MKKIIIIFCCILCTKIGYAQVNFYKFGLGAGFGTNISYTDVKEHRAGYGYYGELLYNLSPFLTTSLEVQAGKLKGGDIIKNEHNREFANKYKSISLNAKIALGQFVDVSQNEFLGLMRGVYLGAGLGMIRNDMSFIVRYKPNTEAEFPPNGYLFPGEDKSTDILIPLNLGVNFYFKNKYDELRYILNLNYQGNVTIGEGLDGYNDQSATFRNNIPDIYTFLSVGVKYNFGPVGISKRIF